MQELEKILEEIENTFKENIENIEDENGVHHFVIDCRRNKKGNS